MTTQTLKPHDSKKQRKKTKKKYKFPAFLTIILDKEVIEKYNYRKYIMGCKRRLDWSQQHPPLSGIGSVHSDGIG